jgi:heptosyltransferase-2
MIAAAGAVNPAGSGGNRPRVRRPDISDRGAVVPSVLVIRFGALGDLCLLAWSLARCAAPRRDAPRMTLVTKNVFADLMSAVPGVDSVVPFAGGSLSSLAALARELRSRPWDAVVDAHGVLRARLLTSLLKRRPDARIAKDTAARLALLLGRTPTAALEQRSMRTRFDELLHRWRPDTDESGGIRPPLAGLAATLPPAAAAERPLGVVPGARWDTKRWPEEHFVAALHAFRRATSAEIRFFLGPREEGWFPGGRLARALPELEPVKVVRHRPVLEVAGALAACRLVLSNDSGLMHLAEAVGTPVVALFGPTVRAFGYAPSLAASVLLERPLACRPCSRNGRRPCWRGDQACLAGLSPATVAHTLLEAAAWPPAGVAAGRSSP